MSTKLIDLYIRIEKRENEEAKKIIEDSNFYNIIDENGCTLLHYAAQLGNLEITQYLLDNNCNVNSQNSLGFSPIMYALSRSSKLFDKVAEVLLNAGADLTLLNNENKNSLHFLFARPHTNDCFLKKFMVEFQKQYPIKDDLGKQLIEAGYQIDQALLLEDVSIIEYMLNNGFSVNYTQTFSPRRTILHLAVINRFVEIVELLCKYNADVNIRDEEKKSPLFYLYVHHDKGNDPKKLQILQILINARTFKANPRQLSYVSMFGPREAINLLFRSNIDFNVQDKIGRTAFYYLAGNRNSGVVEELKKYGNKLKVNSFDDKGGGPLYVATKRCNVKMMEYLLERGARANRFHKIDKCPLIFTAINCLNKQSDKCVEMLLRHNVDLQIAVEADNGSIITVFDILTTDQEKNKLQSILAHLALIEKQGIVMTERTTLIINSQEILRKDFRRYGRILKKKIARTATIFDLMTVNEKVMAKYLSNLKLVVKLRRIRHKKVLKSSYTYYYRTLKQRVSSVLFYNMIKDRVAAVISQLLQYRFDETNIVIEKIIGYLDKRDMLHLYWMYH